MMDVILVVSTRQRHTLTDIALTQNMQLHLLRVMAWDYDPGYDVRVEHIAEESTVE